VSHAGPLRDDPRELPGQQVRPLVAEERQGDPLAADVVEDDVAQVQAFIEHRRAQDGLPGRGDDLRPAPERDRLVDPTRLTKITNEVVSWA